MNSLLEQLLALTGRLGLAAQTPEAMLAELRRFLAAMLIQENPGFLPVISNPAYDAAINAAAQAGAELAAQLDAAGTRLGWLSQPYLCEETAAERPAQVFGPFIDAELALVQFAFFETSSFRAVLVELPIVVAHVVEKAMLLPAGTQADANDARRFDIPAGTVWLLARRLLAEAPGYVALRVTRGSLVFSEPPQAVEPGGTLLATAATTWSLDLEPEPAPAAAAAGSDGDALEVTLPTRLVVQSNQHDGSGRRARPGRLRHRTALRRCAGQRRGRRRRHRFRVCRCRRRCGSRLVDCREPLQRVPGRRPGTGAGGTVVLAAGQHRARAGR